jgi:hypothetical protein
VAKSVSSLWQDRLKISNYVDAGEMAAGNKLKKLPPAYGRLKSLQGDLWQLPAFIPA